MATIEELAKAMADGEKVYIERKREWQNLRFVGHDCSQLQDCGHFANFALQTRAQYEAEEAARKAEEAKRKAEEEARKPKPGEVWGNDPKRPWYISYGPAMVPWEKRSWHLQCLEAWGLASLHH